MVAQGPSSTIFFLAFSKYIRADMKLYKSMAPVKQKSISQFPTPQHPDQLLSVCSIAQYHVVLGF